MTPTITVDTREFHAAMREFLARTSRTLEEAVRTRMFFLLVRVFALLKPKDPQAERNRIRAYLNTPVGERRFDKRTGKKVGKGRMLQLRHLITQARERAKGGPGLYGEAMAKAAAALSRQAIGSVGYLKSGIVKAIKAINHGSFAQFGGVSRGRQYSGNAALIKIAAEYGHAFSNVGIHKGGKAYAGVSKSTGKVYSFGDISWKIADGQEGNVAANINPAFQRAFNDETVEMRRHLASKLQQDANAHMAKPLPVPA